LLEGQGARRAQQRLLAKTSPVLHPLPEHDDHRLRSSPAGRVAHYLGFFLGFLGFAYVSLIILRALWRALVHLL
jgi:hypothetical protein